MDGVADGEPDRQRDDPPLPAAGAAHAVPEERAQHRGADAENGRDHERDDRAVLLPRRHELRVAALAGRAAVDLVVRAVERLVAVVAECSRRRLRPLGPIELQTFVRHRALLRDRRLSSLSGAETDRRSPASQRARAPSVRSRRRRHAVPALRPRGTPCSLSPWEHRPPRAGGPAGRAGRDRRLAPDARRVVPLLRVDEARRRLRRPAPARRLPAARRRASSTTCAPRWRRARGQGGDVPGGGRARVRVVDFEGSKELSASSITWTA